MCTRPNFILLPQYSIAFILCLLPACHCFRTAALKWHWDISPHLWPCPQVEQQMPSEHDCSHAMSCLPALSSDHTSPARFFSRVFLRSGLTTGLSFSWTSKQAFQTSLVGLISSTIWSGCYLWQWSYNLHKLMGFCYSWGMERYGKYGNDKDAVPWKLYT